MRRSIVIALVSVGLLGEVVAPAIAGTKVVVHKYRRSRRGRRARNAAIGAAGGAAGGAILGRGRGAGAGAVLGGTAGALVPRRRR
ncbi:MAG TPA: hypothetical protein VKX45_01060 [Bryobacteraceae bacterium]|jgi:uncharacterized protein YcfJ|nr:hypothetical protein [Bryobacteraceae bacterium]